MTSIPSTTPGTPVADAERMLAAYDRTTSNAGRWTMIAGLVLSLAGPLYLVLFSDSVSVTGAQLWTAVLAVAAVFGVIWIVEPLTYFPILGPAAMYQAFMIGNISSKLLPCALTAQDRIGARPGTRRGDFAAVAAICGAAAVHLASLFIFVGLLGTWLIGQLSPEIILTVRTYILPAVIGAVVVQATINLKQPKIAVVALAVALLVEFVLKRFVPGTAFYATAVAVFATVAVAWFLRDRAASTESGDYVA